MATMWDDAARRGILDRIDRVTGNEPPRWGKMSADRMLWHIAEAMKLATGELTCVPKKIPIRYFPLKQLAIYVLPFAKGLPTAPELVAKGDVPPETSKRELHRLLDQFAALRDKTLPDHPAFGRMSKKAWGVLAWRHLDHHLRQFGM